MKNLQFKLALVTMLLSFAFVPVSAYDFKVDDIYYSVLSMSDLTCKVTSGDTKYSGEISIPEQVTYNKRTFNVIKIDSSAFKNCPGITSLNIPNSVTSIGDYAFYECSSITSLNIPNPVTSIGDYAFSNCYRLTNLTIPNSVTSIGKGAFSNCSDLTNLTIPNSVTSIGDYTFSRCTNLTNLTIPNSVTTIGDYAFEGCPSLTNLTIPNAVITIGDYAFEGCPGLTNLTIPNAVTTIGDYAFSRCTNLTNLTIGNSVTSVGEGVFMSCFALETLTIENGSNTLNLDNTCFKDSPLKSVYLGRNLNSPTFRQKKELTDLTIGSSVTSIGDYAFDGCSSLTNLTIPNSMTTIGDYAFRFCTSLINLNIPNSVTSIGKGAFQYCSGLTNLTIGNSVTTIGDYAFSRCTNLTNLAIGNSVTTIGDYAFDGCSGLTNLTIPNSVTTIENYAFSSCKGLTNLAIPNSVTTIGDYAFLNCKGLTILTISNSVTSVGEGAFMSCFALETLTIENGSNTLNLDNTFNDSPLKSIYLGRNLKSPTFKQKKELTDLTIGSSVTSIGSEYFKGCSNLKTLTIEDGATSLNLDNTCFNDCPLKSVYWGRNLNSAIPTFPQTKELTDLAIGKNVTEIAESALSNCSALKSIISLAKIAPKAYENTFSNATYLNATLYVPIGSMDSYKSSTPWKNFLIEENYPTGTEDVKADNILVEKARYSLDGKMLLAPKKGINIIKMSDGTTKKVFVK